MDHLSKSKIFFLHKNDLPIALLILTIITIVAQVLTRLGQYKNF